MVRPFRVYGIHASNIAMPEFAFYVNKSGWRSRNHFMVYWEGHPRSFGKLALLYGLLDVLMRP